MTDDPHPREHPETTLLHQETVLLHQKKVARLVKCAQDLAMDPFNPKALDALVEAAMLFAENE